jgi:hypothetical protein
LSNSQVGTATAILADLYLLSFGEGDPVATLISLGALVLGFVACLTAMILAQASLNFVWN